MILKFMVFGVLAIFAAPILILASIHPLAGWGIPLGIFLGCLFAKVRLIHERNSLCN